MILKVLAVRRIEVPVALQDRPSPSDLVLDPLARRVGTEPQLQILDAVVGPMSVEVMDDFIPSEGASEVLGHDVPVLKNRPASDIDDPVAVLVDVARTFWGSGMVVRVPVPFESVVVGLAVAESVMRFLAAVHLAATASTLDAKRAVATSDSVVVSTQAQSLVRFLAAGLATSLPGSSRFPKGIAVVSEPLVVEIAVAACGVGPLAVGDKASCRHVSMVP